MSKLIPTFPKLFFCKQCKVFFFTYSKLDKPTHSKCFSHKTRLATIEERHKIININYNKERGIIK